MLWALFLIVGLVMLPESPRWLVKKGRETDAAKSLSRLRSQPDTSSYVVSELAEIVDQYHFERETTPETSYFGSWAACFKGSIFDGHSNIRRTIVGTSLQMMSQWTGVNFVFYYGMIPPASAPLSLI